MEKDEFGINHDDEMERSVHASGEENNDPMDIVTDAVPSTSLVCIDTQAELKLKLAKNKIERKRKRDERARKLEADALDMERKKSVLDRIMARSNAMKVNDDDNPLITPGNGASKVAYGRKKTHVYEPSERERILAKPETLVHIDSIDESEALYLQRGYKEALGLENFGDFFMSQASFVERRPDATSSSSSSSSLAAKKALVNEEEGDMMDTSDGNNAHSNGSLSNAVKKEALYHNWSDAVANTMQHFYKSPSIKEGKRGEQPVAGNALQPMLPPPPPPRPSASDETNTTKKKKGVRGPAKKTLAALKLLDLETREKEKDQGGEIELMDLDGVEDIELGDVEGGEYEDDNDNNATQEEKRKGDAERDSGVTFPASKRAKYDSAPTLPLDDDKKAQKGKRKVGKKAQAKATRAKLESEKLMRSQIALADLSGMRRVDADAANFLFQVGENKAVKAKPPRYNYLIHTETPPSGQSNVRAARRDYLNDNGFNEEAARGLDQNTASVPSSDLGALHDRDRGTVPSVIMAGMETRRIAVIDEKFFEPDEVQQHLMRKGDKLGIDMAKEQAHPSNLPRLPIEGDELRAREQGRDPQSTALRNAIVGLHQQQPMSEVAASGGASLPLVTVSDDDARQPLYKYFKLYGKASRVSADGMIDELVFDQKRILFNTISNVQLYVPDENNPMLASLDENGCKILHKNACQRARNIKKQREPVERQAESEPPRLRTRIADARVEYCLERWNRQDAMFLHDWPCLADPKLEEALIAQQAKDDTNDNGKRKRRDSKEATRTLSSDSTIGPFLSKRKAAMEDLLKKASYGPLGQLLSRHRIQIADRGHMTGTRYFVSSEELGTSRLHPSANIAMRWVKKAHYLAFMEQPRRGERGCINGHECYCYKSSIQFNDATTYFSMTNTMGFVCKEFLFEDEYLRFQLTGELPAQRRTCIVCMLDEVTRLAYSMMRSDIPATRAIHDHCVYVDKEGEFSLKQCLPLSWRMNGRQVLSGIVGPFLEFNEGDYLHDVRLEDGVPIRFLRYHPPRSGF